MFIGRLWYEIKVLEFFYRFRKSAFKFKKENLMNLSKNTNIPLNKLCFDYILASYKTGCTIDDYILLDFYKKSNKERKEYIVTKQNGRLAAKFNKKATQEDRNDFINKAKFNQVFKKYVNRKSLYCKNKEEIEKFIDSIEDKFIMKPLNLNGGKGIKIIKKQEIKNKDGLINQLIEGKYVIEECLKQCQEMNKLNPTSINTVRPFAIRTKQDEIKIIGCIVRFGKKGAMIDNVSSGGGTMPCKC